GGILPATGAPRITEVFYIKPTEGTAIQNGVGTLTVEAHRIYAGVDELLSTGSIQLYEGSTLITVANGYAAGSDGYTGVLDAGDISGFAIVELKDGPSGGILDSITLVDIDDGADGDDAIYGSIEPENGLAWTQAVNGGAWTPAQQTSDLDCTFYQAGVAVARIARRVTLTSADGALAATTTAHKDGDLNTGRVTVTVTGGGSMAINVEFAYSFGGELATVAETLKSVQGGDDGGTGGTGDDGLSVFTANVFKRSATPPSTPAVDDGSYNFTTNVLTPPSGWSGTLPAGTDPLYVSTGSFSIVGPTGIDTTVIWTSPDLFVQDGGVGQPGNIRHLIYDDLDTTQLAAGQSRYAMLTDRAVHTSGSQNNFHLTDGILLNKADFDGANQSLFYSTVEVEDRIAFWISATRFLVFEVDETFTTVGTGAAEAYKFGVFLVDALDPDPTVNIPTSAGTPVQFQFNVTPTLDGNLLDDPDFDFSSSLPVMNFSDEDDPNFWDNITHWVGIKSHTSPSTSPGTYGWTFNSGTGPNNSNTISLITAIPITSGNAHAWLVARRRLRTNMPSFDIKLRILNDSPSTNDVDLQIQIRGYSSPTDSTPVVTWATGFKVLYTDGVTYTDLEFHIEADSDPDAQYWEFRLGFFHVVVHDIGEVTIDSIFVYATPRTFGSNTFQDEGGGNAKYHPGLVPLSDVTVDSGKVLQADGTWVANTGGGAPVDSVFGRTGAVTAQSSDYSSFYSAVGHVHAAGDITSGVFVVGRIPNLNASKITAGTFVDARIPNL
ncbi:hypothetical protein LCGC14_1953500, partial [marine sediment metagenome]